MSKQLTIALATLLVLFGFMIGNVEATQVVTANAPGNNTVKTNPVTFNITVAGNQSTYSCTLYSDYSGTWQPIETNSGVANNTATVFNSLTITEKVAGGYNWNTVCTSTQESAVWITSTTSNTSNANSAYVFGVDSTNPVITATPATLYWDNNGYINITVTVVDNNPNTCILRSTMNTSSNGTQPMTAYSAQSYSNNTAFNPTGFDEVTIYMADNNTGAYVWNLTCTDKAGNTEVISNRIIYVDKTAPSAFAFNTSAFFTDNDLLWLNNTLISDYTPEIGYAITTEANFARYRLRLYETSCDSAIYVETNESTITNLHPASNTLTANKVYYVGVTAFDLAGNQRNITGNCNTYYKTTTSNMGHNLNTGWNIVPNMGNAKAASDLLTETGATTIAYFNATGAFQTYVSGGTSFTVPSGKPFFAYKETTTVQWNDLIVNVTAHGTKVNLTNMTGTQWNLWLNLNTSNSFTFANIDYSFNLGNSTFGTRGTNISYMVYFNNSASTNAKYVDYKSNWSFKASTPIAYGDPIWVLNNIVSNTTNYAEFDWTAISDKN